MGQLKGQPHRYTAEEYLALEVQREIRHDFYEGQILTRPGDTLAHNNLAMNCVAAFRQALRGSNTGCMRWAFCW